MKGVMIHYDDKKGFGFIKDENEDERFFHISNLYEKSEFLTNLSDY
jgi:cold shock CspA family protein